jgi:hypothetical protein
MDVAGKFVWVRPGVAMPDWSLATAEAARQALAAMTEIEGLLTRLSNFEPIEDGVWRAVLEGYPEAGRAPFIAEIASRTGLDPQTVRRVLRRLQARDVVLLDESGDAITGAYPLRAHTLHAMCAIDALGVGAMYGEDVAIESACLQCGHPIAIRTRDRGFALKTAVPGGAVVWAGLHYANKCAATSLCRVLAFFCGDEHLESWRRINAPNPADGMRLTLAEALQLGKAHFVPSSAPASNKDKP